jgi:tetratricopeptide (TPR) repeat protein
MLTLINASPTFTATIPQNAIHDPRSRLAQMYLETGKTTAALPLLETVVDALKSQNPLPPLLLDSENMLARAYLKLHRPESALRLLRAVVERRQRLLGKSDFNFLKAQMISIEAYMDLGNLILAGKVLSLVRETCRFSPDLEGALRGDLRSLAYKLEDMNDALKEEENSRDKQGGSTKGIKSKM